MWLGSKRVARKIGINLCKKAKNRQNKILIMIKNCIISKKWYMLQKRKMCEIYPIIIMNIYTYIH